MDWEDVPQPTRWRRLWEDYPDPVVDTESGCLRWQGPHWRNNDDGNSGYGRLGDRGFAHRIAWEREVGPIPKGMVIDHVWECGCRWKDCVLIAHLEPVPKVENSRRGKTARAHRAKTHCPQDHPYDEANTIHRYGKRYCRKCKNAHSLAAYYRKKNGD